MPDEIQYDANATPPQFTNNADMVIEPGTHVRVKIIGLRTEVGEMWAIGSINGDFLGYVHALFRCAALSELTPCQMSSGIDIGDVDLQEASPTKSKGNLFAAQSILMRCLLPRAYLPGMNSNVASRPALQDLA